MMCEHNYCRCMRAAELAAMGRTMEAVEVHNQKVVCRWPERVEKDNDYRTPSH